MQTKRQNPESQKLMLQLTRELVDRDIDRIVEERLQEKMKKRKRGTNKTLVEKYICSENKERSDAGI
jgi:parvulin-like peptidyl-prolyl isomerase